MKYDPKFFVADKLAPIFNAKYSTGEFYVFGSEPITFAEQQEEGPSGQFASIPLENRSKIRWGMTRDTYETKHDFKPSKSLDREIRVRDLFLNNPKHKIKVSKNEKWDNYISVTSAPLTKIRDAIDIVYANSYRKANTIMIPPNIMQTLGNHPDIIDMCKYCGVTKEAWSVSKSKTDNSSSRILFGLEIFPTTKSPLMCAVGDPNFPETVWGNNVIVCYLGDRPPCCGTVQPAISFICGSFIAEKIICEDAYCVISDVI